MKTNLNIAIKASLKAGEAIMKIYNSADINVEYKKDKSPLTEADKSANEIINSYLKTTNIPIISEENKQLAFTARKDWKTCWVVDPVDGTKEFIKKNGEFTVNIALVKNGKPELGVIYVPASKTLYFADVTDKKAYKCNIPNTISELDIMNIAEEISPQANDDSKTIKVVASRSHINQETLNFIEALKAEGKNVETVSQGSSLKFCLMAEGKADVYPRFAPTMEWDTAAGHAICNSVGLKVISQKTKEPLFYNKENLLNPWFIVSK